MLARRIIHSSYMPALLVLIVALGVRFVYLHQIRDNPFFESPIIDAQMYDARAQRIAAGDLIGGPVYYQAPLYSFFLGGIYALFGHDYVVARAIQLTLSAINCVLVFVLARMAFGTLVGCIAGIGAALYGTLIFYDAQLLRPVLVVFLLLSSLLAIGRAQKGGRLCWWAVSGVLIGLATLTRETSLVLLPAVLIWHTAAFFNVKPRKPLRRLVVSSLVLVGAIAAVIVPVTARNWHVGHEFVLVSSQGGLNFYIGNNPQAARTTVVQPGADWEAVASLPARKAGIWRPKAQSRWFYTQVFRFVAQHPGQWLRAMWRKIVFFGNAYEIEPNNAIAYFKGRSLLGVLMKAGPWVIFPFGIVAPIALLGLALRYRRDSMAALLRLLVLGYAAAVVLFHVRARYRLPIVPVLIIFAAWVLVWAGRCIVERRWRAVTAVAIVVTPLFWAVNADHFDIQRIQGMPTSYFVGLAHLQRGRLAEAVGALKQATRSDPEDVNSFNSLGVAFQRMRHYADAEKAYRQAIRLRPEYRVPHNNLGRLYLQRGVLDTAVAELKRAVDIDPSYMAAHNNLGIAYLRQNRLDSAAKQFVFVTQLAPSYAPAQFNLGLVRYKQRRFSDAAAAFAATLKLNPQQAEAQRGHAAALRALASP